jgi:glycosyltransferase involved in cell wall biosynthesis
MRILVIAACPLPWPRGTPIRIHRMAEALVERGHEIHMATYPLGDDSVETNYQLHRVRSTNGDMDASPGPSLKKLFWLDPQLWGVVRRLLAEKHFDIVHAHHYEGLLTALCARSFNRKLPIVYDAHTLLATELPHYHLHVPKRTIAMLGATLDRSLPPRADHIITVTERMQQWFLEHAPKAADRLSLIPNGVEHEHFKLSNGHAGRRNGSNGRAPRIVFAGNLAEYQGVGALLDAFARVRDEAADARLVFITDSGLGQWEQRIEELAIGSAVDVVSAGFDTLPEHLEAADVVVNPRIDCDGIPQKLLNYMAAARPIVSFAGSAAILQHEQTGLVVPDADIDAFAGAVLRVLRTPALGSALGDAARREVEKAHSWQQVAGDVEAVYVETIARAARA